MAQWNSTQNYTLILDIVVYLLAKQDPSNCNICWDIQEIKSILCPQVCAKFSNMAATIGLTLGPLPAVTQQFH